MNKKLFGLPLLAVLALTGCNGNTTPKETKDGNVPEGGTVVEKEEETEKLAELVQKTSKTISISETVGLTLSSTGLNAEVASTNLNGKVGLGAFELKAGGENLATGTKATTKVGVEFSGVTASIKLNGTSGESEEEEQSEVSEASEALEASEESEASTSINIDKSLTIGKTAAYLDNGNLYVDASETGIPQFVSTLAGIVEPYTAVFVALLGVKNVASTTAAIQPILASMADNPTISDTLLKSYLGISEYKFKFDDVAKDENYPLFKEIKTDIDLEQVKEQIDGVKASFEEKTKLKWNDIVKFYTYSDESSAIQFEMNKDNLTSLIKQTAGESYEVTLTDDSSVKAAVAFDKNGFPTSFSVKETLGATIGGEEVEAKLGSKLTVKESGDLKLSVSTSNPVTFPESFDGYKVPRIASSSSSSTDNE